MSSSDRDAAFAAVRAALMASYSGSLAATRMSPLEALECMAAALGSVYREVADTHIHPDGCHCGWVPHEMMDLVALEQAIAANATSRDDEIHYDLHSVTPVGHG